MLQPTDSLDLVRACSHHATVEACEGVAEHTGHFPSIMAEVQKAGWRQGTKITYLDVIRRA
jgi:hypothetical protein